MTQGVLVFAEVTQGGLAAIAKEMLGAGRRLADALGEPLMVAVLGSGVQEAAQEATPNILLIGMGDIGREIGPRLAFRLRTGLASDCVELTINPDTRLLEA